MSSIRQICIFSHSRPGTEYYKKNIKNLQNLRKCFENPAIGHLITPSKDWYKKMEATREKYGHNTPHNGRGKNTILYHQWIAFSPKEIDIYGGKMKLDDCNDFVMQYIDYCYPDHEVIFASHKEYCKKDDIYRYAVHMAINRTNIVTGKRFSIEGRWIERGLTATERETVWRVCKMRDLDGAWGLKQDKIGNSDKRIFLFPGEEKVFI